VLVGGGILRYAVHEFQELGWLPGEDNVAFDLTSTFPADGVIATFARGLLSVTPKMTWFEVAVWLAYVIPTLIAFFWVISRRKGPKAAAPADSADSAVGSVGATPR
jgi:high-affinity iron transporter